MMSYEGRRKPRQPNHGYGQYQQQAEEVFLVLEGAKVCAVYRWRDDANNHAAVVGGSIVVLQVKDATPQWVKTMLEGSKDKALRQSGIIRD